jgi:Putative prokaryotic signal transducing protein
MGTAEKRRLTASNEAEVFTMAKSDAELEQRETNPEAWVTVMRLISPAEIAIVQSVLESAGIPYFLANENANRILGFEAAYFGGVRIQVKKEDAEAARQALSEQTGEIAENTEEAHNEGSDGL